MAEPIAIADLLDAKAPRRDVNYGITFVAMFAAAVIAAIGFNNIQWPWFAAFVPICATLWGVADLLTAYLLLTQFSINGVRAFAVLGAAYIIPGVLTMGYLVFFPDLFFIGPTSLGLQQVSVWLWIVWHIAFPLVLGGYHLFDRDLSVRITSEAGVRRWLGSAVTVSAIGCAATLALIVALQDRLPTIIDGGHFTPIYSTKLAPIIVAINVLAALAIVSSKRSSRLQLWLGVALCTAALDGALNALSSGRYTVSWYVGKLETLATATVVLMILLSEVGALYRRLGQLATIDGLTGIANRQSFDSDARFALHLHRRSATELAFLVVDVDFFKQYNDRYGHHAGDLILRRVAESLRASCTREVDLVGRFGGEEFVILLPGTNEEGAMRVGEAIRSGVERLGIAHESSSVAKVLTVSIGAAVVQRGTTAELEALFRRADLALYQAKHERNSMVLAEPAVATTIADARATPEHLVTEPLPATDGAI